MSVCKGGCGKELPASNKSGYAWGHAKGCIPSPASPPATSEEGNEPEQVEELPTIDISFTEPLLDQIWSRLPLKTKADAIATYGFSFAE